MNIRTWSNTTLEKYVTYYFQSILGYDYGYK